MAKPSRPRKADLCGSCKHWPFILKAAEDRDGDNLAHSVDYCRNCARRLAAENARLRGQVKKLEGLITDWAADKGWTPEEGFADMRGAAARIAKRKGK